MGKSCKNPQSSSSLPLTPLLYINDPQIDIPNIRAISAVIPSTKLISCKTHDGLSDFYRGNESKETVVIVAGNLSDEDHKHKSLLANSWKTATIKQGRNFASVNLYLQSGTPSEKLKDWGTNHLDLDIAQSSPVEAADRVYRWLFTVLSVPETLHLIPQSEMGELATDTRNFPHYAYCPLSESRIRPKDAKIQFVALITNKPEVTPGKVNPKTGKVDGSKLVWTVADRTGTATFYFLSRGPSSQATWDWVLALKPGDRRALPRMPSVEIKEPSLPRIAKSPFRLLGGTVSGTGKVISALGHGLGHVGSKISMGKSRKWVPEADVTFDAEGRATHKDDGGSWDNNAGFRAAKKEHHGTEKAPAEIKREVKVFDEKGRRLWGDEDSLASTEGGSIVDCKEFA